MPAGALRTHGDGGEERVLHILRVLEPLSAIAFSATTPTTGQATATSGRTTTTIDLLAMATAPPA